MYAVWLGYLFAKTTTARAVVRRVGDEDERRVHQLWRIGVVVAFAAFVVQIALIGTVPLISVAVRWQLNPKLIQAILWMAALAPMGLLVRGWRRGPIIVAAASFAALSVLATRTMVLDLVIALLIAMCLFVSPRRLAGMLLAVGLASFVVFATVGVISKSQIYGGSSNTYDITKAFALLQTDSIGTFHNLDRVRTLTDEHGTQHGSILGDTALNMIPGLHRDYANFRLGALLNGRTTLTINGQVIDRSVSLTTTFVGPAYADGGALGVFGIGALFGLLLGTLEEVAVRSRWFAGVFGFWVAEMFGGIYGGLISETTILVTFLVCVAGIVAVRQRSASRSAANADEPAAVGVRDSRRRSSVAKLPLPGLLPRVNRRLARAR